MNFLLKNGIIVDPAVGKHERKDLIVKDKKVYSAPDGCSSSKYIVIDCSGKIITPGFIDVHTHLRDPGFEYKEDIITGSKSAVAGGVTSIFCMPNTVPVVDNIETVHYIIEKAKRSAVVNVYPIAAMTMGSEGLEPVAFEQLLKIGVVSFSDDGRWVRDSRIMCEIMRFSAQSGVRIIQHCEDIGIANKGVINLGRASKRLNLPGIPVTAEDVAVYRDIELCALTGAHVHIAHVSSARSLELIEQAKHRGIDITCEVAPHHLVLNDECIKQDDANYKVNPPLRTKDDSQTLIEGLKNGVVDMIATDHAPHAEYEKNKGFLTAPFGLIGMETAFPVLYTRLVKDGIMSLMDIVTAMSSNPARLFGLKNKGSLADGFDADIAVIDLETSYKIDKNKFYSKSKNSPYHGWNVCGKITDVFVEGNLVYTNGEIAKRKESLL